METRDIINADGQVIGTLTLPDNTTEAEWQARLAVYATPVPEEQA